MDMRRIALLISVVAVIAAACGAEDDGTAAGDSDEPTTTAAPTTTSTPTTTTEAPEEMMNEGLHTAQTELGTVLVGGTGFTLYLFLPDAPGVSNCVEECAAAWPPLAADEIGTTGDGIDVSLLGEITRADGSTQATYNGKPLYFFSGDAASEEVNGQGFNDVWFVLGPDGKGIGIPRADEDSEGLGY